MTDAVYVEQASEWARWLTLREAQGPGDMPRAWERLERRYGVPGRIFWCLRYRPPKTLSVSIYARLKHAYDAERERQLRLLRHDLEITKAVVGPTDSAVVAVQALVGEED